MIPYISEVIVVLDTLLDFAGAIPIYIKVVIKFL